MLIERDSNLRLYIGNSSWADTLSSQRISVYIFVFQWNGPNPASFCSFSFFSDSIFKRKIIDFGWIQTQIVGVEGKNADY